MALTQLGTPYPVFTDLDGTPLDGGYVYFGVIDENPETSPITVYYDPGLTQPAAQPLRTSNGYVMRNGSPAILYAGSLFSVTVRNKNSALVVYAQAGYGVSPYEIAGPASAEVVIVAGIAANVTTVAGVASDVAALGPIASDITAAVSNAANITTVAGISGDVTIVADNVTDVTTFAKVYLGGKATAPTVRNDGGALQEGDLYFNTASDNLFVWGGAAWLAGIADAAGTLLAINNLSDVASASASLANLGLTATAAELNQIDGKTVIGTDTNITTTPAYSGQALKYLRVNAGETAAEFAAIPTPVELSQVQVEDDTSTVFGQVSGQRLSQAVAANSGFTLLATTEVTTAVSFVDFTAFDATAYAGYIFTYSGVRLSGGLQMAIRFSTDGGATFLSAADYHYAGVISASNTASLSVVNSTTGTEAWINQGNTGVRSMGQVVMYEPDLNEPTLALFDGTVQDGSFLRNRSGGCSYQSNSVVNGLRFLVSGGTYTDGVFRMYGMAR